MTKNGIQYENGIPIPLLLVCIYIYTYIIMYYYIYIYIQGVYVDTHRQCEYWYPIHTL